MISALLSNYLVDKCTLVTCVQNKAVCALVEKLAATDIFFMVIGARCAETQAQLATRVLPLTLRYTAWEQAQDAALKAQARWRWDMGWHSSDAESSDEDSSDEDAESSGADSESASSLMQSLLMQESASEDSASSSEDSASGWNSCDAESSDEAADASPWAVLTDSLLLRHEVKRMVTHIVEERSTVLLSTVDSTHKVWRHPDVVIVDEAGSVPEWKMPLLM